MEESPMLGFIRLAVDFEHCTHGPYSFMLQDMDVWQIPIVIILLDCVPYKLIAVDGFVLLFDA